MRNRVMMICSCLTLAAFSAGAQSAGGGGGSSGGGGAAAGGASGGSASGGAVSGARSGTTGGAGLGTGGGTTAGTANGTSVNTRFGVNTGSRNGTTVNTSQAGPQTPLPTAGANGAQNGQFNQPPSGNPQYGSQNQFWTGATNQGGFIDPGIAPGAVVGGSDSAQPALPTTGPTAPPAQPQSLPPTSNRSESRTFQSPRPQETGDKAFTADDQSLLIRLREDVMPVVRGSQTGISPVHFSIRHGVVTVWGDVPTSEIRQQVVEKLNGATGVVQVIDQISVGSQAQGAPIISGAATATPGTSSGGLAVPQSENLSPGEPRNGGAQATSNTFQGSFSAPFSVGSAGTNLVTADQLRRESQPPEK